MPVILWGLAAVLGTFLFIGTFNEIVEDRDDKRLKEFFVLEKNKKSSFFVDIEEKLDSGEYDSETEEYLRSKLEEFYNKHC